MTTTDSSPASSQTSSQPAVPAAAAAPAAASSAAAAPVPDASAAAPAPTAAAAAPAAAAAAPAAAAPAAAVPDAAAAAAAAAAPKPGEAAAAAATAVPENYAFTLPQTDAFKGIELNAAALPAMAPAFKEAGITQAQLDKILPAFVQFQMAQPAAMLARDLDATMKDQGLGGLNWGRTQGYVNDALGAFTTPEFRQKLDRWGIANDLEFVRVFAAIGKAMQGDTPARGQPTGAEPTTRAQRMYGKTSGQQ